MEKKTTTQLTRTGIMIALACALSFFKVIELANGGSVTLGSMVPIILISYTLDFKKAILTSFCYSLTQMLFTGIAVPPTENFFYYMLVIMLDYVIAFSVLGLAGPVTRKIKNTVIKVISGSVIAVALRILFHFLSGILIWGVYAPEGQSVYIYSLVYNASYMIPELVLTVLIMILLSKTRFFKKEIL